MVQWLRLCLPMPCDGGELAGGVLVPSLVGELRSHMPQGQKPRI